MITITNLTEATVDKKLLTDVAKKVLKGENILIEKEISIVLVNSQKIKELNEKYRKKDGPTDVLSFSGENDFLGEIVICPEVVESNAEKSGTDFQGELIFVLIHGLLHLLGYDHEKTEKDAEEMRKKEEKYLIN